MDRDARIEMLVAENEVLRARIASLEEALGATLPPPLEWRLTGAEARVFGVLYRREFASRDALMTALYHDLGRDESEPKIVDVFICKLRRKLKPFGIEVTTVWGRGYQLPALSRQAAAAFIDRARAA